MKKVLHVLEHSLPKLAGYTIRSKYIVDNQMKDGICPVVITSPLQGKTDASFKDCEEINKIRYYRTGEFNTLNESDPLPVRLLKRYSYSRAYRKAIRWVAEKEGVSIIHSHSSYLNGIRGNQAARMAGVPSVYEVRGLWQDTATVNSDIDTRHWKYRFIDHMDRKAMLEADAVIAISKQLKDELIVKGVKEERVHVVPNGVDTGRFSPREKNRDITARYGLDGRVVFGFIGSIRKIEGLSLFLECLPRIIKRAKDIRVLLTGEGDEVPRLKELTVKLGLEKHVIFTGVVSHDRILDYYSAIDIFIYPRIDARVNHKVTPLKPLEAMAMEKLVIASDVGGLKELVEDNKNGILFRVGDREHLIERCIDVIEDLSLRHRIAKDARIWCVKERDWAKIIKLYGAVYSALVPDKA